MRTTLKTVTKFLSFIIRRFFITTNVYIHNTIHIIQQTVVVVDEKLLIIKKKIVALKRKAPVLPFLGEGKQ